MEYVKGLIKNFDEIKNLRKKTIENLIDISLPIWDDSYPSEDLIKEDIDKGNVRIVLDEGKIIAFAVLDRCENEFGEYIFDEPNLMVFSRLMVDPENRNKGVGSFLVDNLCLEMKKEKASGCGIMVHPINTYAINFYEKNGFVFEKRKNYPYGDFSTYVKIFKNS